MNEEKKLDDLLEIDDSNYNTKIKRKINRILFKKISFLFSIFLFIILLIIGFSKLQNYIKEKKHEAWEVKQQYYDPTKEDLIVVENRDLLDTKKDIESPLFDELFKVSVELLFPRITVLETDITQTDLYTYKFSYNLSNAYNTHYIYDGQFDCSFIIDRSKMIDFNQTGDYRLTYYGNLFKLPNTDDSDYYDQLSNSELEEVKKLPDSAMIDVAISFNDYYGTSKIIELINRYPKSKFSWVAVDATNRQSTYYHQDGFKLYNGAFSDDFLQLNETYPNICLTSSHPRTKEVLESSYLSQLQFLLDHDRFLNLENNFWTKQEIQDKFNQATQMIKDKGEIQFIGICALLKKEDFLDLIEKENIQYASIQDVKLSILQK